MEFKQVCLEKTSGKRNIKRNEILRRTIYFVRLSLEIFRGFLARLE